MSRLKMGIVRYASAAGAIAEALGLDNSPDIRIGHGRIKLTFHALGASRWPDDRQIEYALRVAGLARDILGRDARRVVRQRASRAIVVVYEDSTLVRGCAVLSRWECVVPSPS